MLSLSFQFPSGRYHGTRWGTHVNEADLDWPPSPWRLMRAFLAVGYSKLGWSEPIPDVARSLIETLSSVPPTFTLPEGATTSHTRHYMPQYKAGTSSKILDSFVHLGRRAELGVHWDVNLEPAELELLDQVLDHLSYLGRAESWVEARRGAPNQSPLPCGRDQAANTSPAPLLCPVPAAEYAAWREAALEMALEANLETRRQIATSQGKTPPKALSKSQRATIERDFPTDIIGALSTNTGALRKAGWSQPPGSVEHIYWRPNRAIETAPVRQTRPRTEEVEPPTMALLQVSSETKGGNVLPLLKTAVRRCNAIHKQLAKAADGKPCALVLVGRHGSTQAQGHQHLHCLALPLGYAGARRDLPTAPIDHVLLWAPKGFDRDAQDIIWRLYRDRTKAADLRLTCVGMGDQRLFSRSVPHAGQSRVWASQTPYVPPRHIKARGRNSLEGQIREGLESRGFGSPSQIRLELEDQAGSIAFQDTLPNDGRPMASWRHFLLLRHKTAAQPPKPRRFSVEIRFETPQQGPIALGYGSHFGLGLFTPKAE